MSKFLDAWNRFEEEFLAAIANCYNEEDEAEYIEPFAQRN
jgi:hypothetical protein